METSLFVWVCFSKVSARCIPLQVSVGRLLKKLGLPPQKPLRKAYQRNEELVTKWRNEDYPKIRAMAKQENATIYFGDESTIRSDYHSGTTWAPKGKTPVVETTGARFSVNMISAISPKGSLRFKAINGKMNASKFIDFLKRLRHGATNPIYLIVDGHPVHKSSAVKKYVESTDGMLKLFLLPPYSPHLNPDELVWSYLKHHKLGKVKIALTPDFRTTGLSGICIPIMLIERGCRWEKNEENLPTNLKPRLRLRQSVA
ncbi:IS630 family transposase [Desulfoluna spongiiphila]|uniref:IS630 family transposase n=1 Tax=Desulfoluna spongiiphila TaxID=419481 RepID=UPI001D018172|nr:IS630 family transposase [Desulfoluna spongiiphila]